MTPWTAAHQAPLSVELCRQEYWSRLPWLSSGILPDPGIKPKSPVLAVRFFATEPPGKPSRFLVSSFKVSRIEGKPGVLRFLGLQRVRHNLETEQQTMCPLKDDGELQKVLFKVLLLPKFYQRQSIDFNLNVNLKCAGDQPRLIQGILSGDGVGEDQETIA